MNKYIVTFDRRPTAEFKAFHEAFVKHPKFRNWWHYIRSCYLINTELTANQISDHFIACAREAGMAATHLVVKVDLQERQGMLIKDAWEWIKKISAS